MLPSGCVARPTAPRAEDPEPDLAGRRVRRVGGRASVPLAVVASLGVAVALGVVARLAGVTGIERRLARAVVDLPGWTTTPLEVAMQAGSRLAILAAAAALALAGRRRPALVVAAAGTAAWLAALAGKHLVGRPRPAVELLGRGVRTAVEGFGYPSSHAAIAVALVAAALVTLRPGGRAAGALVALASLTALARVHVGAHWPLDVVGGAAIGIATALAAAASVPPGVAPPGGPDARGAASPGEPGEPGAGGTAGSGGAAVGER